MVEGLLKAMGKYCKKQKYFQKKINNFNIQVVLRIITKNSSENCLCVDVID
jgi:hypothetical protein